MPAKTHGLSRTTREYKAWSAIKQRCLNPNSKAYIHYGARGITICDEWKDSFVSFMHDMGERPSTSHSIERIDNDGNYEPSNCRWATKTEQQHNRRPFGKSGVKGVYWNGHNWYIRIQKLNDSIYSGTYKTVEEALKAYPIIEAKLYAS